MTLLVFRLKFMFCQISLVNFNKDHLDCSSLASIIARISFNNHEKLWYQFLIWVLLCGFLRDVPQMTDVNTWKIFYERYLVKGILEVLPFESLEKCFWLLSWILLRFLCPGYPGIFSPRSLMGCHELSWQFHIYWWNLLCCCLEVMDNMVPCKGSSHFVFWAY